MTAPLIFLDTETTGLSLDDDIWELAAIRREPDGTEEDLHLFIEHDEQKCMRLPETFRADHLARFPGHDQASRPEDAAYAIYGFTRVRNEGGKPHIVGAVPNFDTERLTRMLARVNRKPEWHYHLIDVENLAVGWLHGKAAGITAATEGEVQAVTPGVATPPWESDELSRACGVEPPGEGERHTAMGDARWAMRLYDAITGGAS